MDNFTIDVTGEGDKTLAKALEIAFEHNAPGAKATHYRVVRLAYKTRYHANRASDKHKLPENLDGVPGWHVHHTASNEQCDKGDLTLILLWHVGTDAMALPYPLGVADAIPFVKGWLENAGDPGDAPDIDGDTGRGWRVFTESWGHVAGSSYAVVGVQACYAWYGK